MELKTLHVEEPAAGVWKVTLFRPEQLNALDTAMIDDLFRVTEEIRKGYPDKVRVIMLCGAGRAFSSGGDLNAFRAVLGKEKHEIQHFIGRFFAFARKWYALPTPTIACIQGIAAGGGAALALLCDIRYASPEARFTFLFSKIGLIPDLGAHFLLPKLVGPAKALEWLYTGKDITAEEAAATGLVNHVFHSEHLELSALALAKQLAQGVPEVYRVTKRLVQDSYVRSLSDVMEKETIYQTERFFSREFQNAIQRFFHKENRS